MRVAVVADDDRERDRLDDLARDADLDVVVTMNVASALAEELRGVHVVIAAIDGLDDDTVAHLVSGRRSTPTVTVDARDDGRLEFALAAGAADHLEHPVRIRELGARVRAAERHRQGRAVIRTDDFELDLDAHSATARGAPVHLTPREWSLIELLVTHRTGLIRQHEALAALGRAPSSGDAYLRGCMHAIRHKLEPTPEAPRYFLTVPRVGVRFDPEPTS